MDIEFRHLRLVVELADAGSTARAAARLGMAQAALAAQLGRIEARLGGQLFRHDAPGVALTEFGEVVVAKARLILSDARELRGFHPDRPRPERAPPRLRLASYPSSPLTALARGVRALRPDTGITASTEISCGRMVDLLAAGELDVVLLREIIGNPLPLPRGVRTRVLLPTDPPFIGLPADHPLADLPEVPLAALADAEWILSADPDDPLIPAFLACCARHGFTPDVTARAGDSGHMAEFVAAGNGACLVAASSTPSPGVVIRALTGAEGIHRRWLLAWRPGRGADDLIDAIHQLAITAFRDCYRQCEHARSWFAAHPGVFPEF
ncbi:LysR family transcriptional regulator [Actinokineospora fastidiosa]|uniref:Transcriptional regulator n=1 Tax=Actinokineospora fastidiosa TaxID=1816 RepID=A0A918GGZ3_9PSEU|nr:LysR family transcriptional regulator [Actinokineospora fastidiosa]GGS34998.1 transcriptional regulator [Actinokineospora fastidiosa]